MQFVKGFTATVLSGAVALTPAFSFRSIAWIGTGAFGPLILTMDPPMFDAIVKRLGQMVAILLIWLIRLNEFYLVM